ncbi:2-keto-3-deoxy-galactonokinase [Chelatococcus sambhunathii]|uniref:2-keto-3-deoxy-galactonokinase n=1 Tax=Chelatococcus sambhunathii TaxID=363953 RepID=A0ABM9U7D1_9HYPH|nr:2-dehydro-3-deoxygalactonokinase [Chelatococcus sambhunathii]CUA88899.1 2-keto-3-deoxy-galactonokinase [Chelatococcus sambhunathii]
MQETVLVGVDWGTTNLRAYAFAADGSLRAKTARPTGITRMTVPYGDLLEELCGEFGAGADTPALLCGMVGSRQGWIEARYITTPCTLDGLVDGLVSAPHASRRVLVVPGLDSRSGRAPDVMRGEETQLLGLMDGLGDAERLVCMPGTHCKWVRIAGGRILDFRSYMTGEAFAALKDHTILGRQMRAGAAHDAAAFETGVAMAQEARRRGPGALLNLLFGVRTLGLFERLSAEAAPSLMSGLMIGAEIADALGPEPPAEPVVVVGSAGLSARYRDAARALGVRTAIADEDIATRGLWAIARAAKLASR